MYNYVLQMLLHLYNICKTKTMGIIYSTSRKIVKFGNSLGITLPYEIIKLLEVEPNKEVVVKVITNGDNIGLLILNSNNE